MLQQHFFNAGCNELRKVQARLRHNKTFNTYLVKKKLVKRGETEEHNSIEANFITRPTEKCVTSFV